MSPSVHSFTRCEEKKKEKQNDRRPTNPSPRNIYSFVCVVDQNQVIYFVKEHDYFYSLEITLSHPPRLLR